MATEETDEALSGEFSLEAVAARQALRESAVSKLVGGQVLTEEEARLMVGAGPSFIPDVTAPAAPQ
jgi:hypothetical protein